MDQQNDLPYKGTGSQATSPEFNPSDLHCERGKLTPASCPFGIPAYATCPPPGTQTLTHTLLSIFHRQENTHKGTHIHTLTNKEIHVILK